MNIGEDQALSSLSERQSPSPCPLTSPHKFTFIQIPESSKSQENNTPQINKQTKKITTTK